jgi:excisionase family DNA binding protein
MAMKLETRVFDLYEEKYSNLSEVARAMGMKPCQIYRVKQGKCGIGEKFITRALKAFPGYTLNDLFYVVRDGDKKGETTKTAAVAVASRRDEIVKLNRAGASYAEIGYKLSISRERVRQIVNGNPAKPRKPVLDSRRMLTSGEVAQLLGLHVNTVRRWCRAGKLKAYRITPMGDRRFRREDVEHAFQEEEAIEQRLEQSAGRAAQE